MCFAEITEEIPLDCISKDPFLAQNKAFQPDLCYPHLQSIQRSRCIQSSRIHHVFTQNTCSMKDHQEYQHILFFE